MYPHPVRIFGAELAIWNVAFLVSVALGYVVLLASLAIGERTRPPRWLPLRWLVTVYLSALGAQLFAYLFDLNTSILPPPSVSWLRYYFDPLYGPKTLYGAVITLPLGMLIAAAGEARYDVLLERWTPAMMATLGGSRIGCFLEGCCYGRRDDTFGIVFPHGSPVYYRQLFDHLIAPGGQALPVIATQVIEAAILFGLCGWSLWAIRRARPHVFAHGVALYSVARLLLEFIRDDPERNALGPLSASQWIALAILAMYGAWRLMSPRSPAPAASAFPR